MIQTTTSRQWVRAAVLALFGILAAWSWLFVVSKWGPARRIDILTFKAGVTSQITRTLLQPAYQAGHHSHAAPMMSGLYATPEYFAMTEQTQDAAKYSPDKFLVFYTFEDIHIGVLPKSSPEVTLRTDEGRQYTPFQTTVLRDSVHHRATLARFAGVDAQGKSVVSGNTRFLELTAHQPGDHSVQVMRWNLPISYPANLQKGTDMSLATLLALLAGLLAVLSPCLLQLTIYYTFALAGVNIQRGPDDIVDIGAGVLRTALSFIAGFTFVFTAAGALAGLAGEKLQSSGILEDWQRPLAVTAGLGILLLGLWVGVNSGAPGLCRLPLPATARIARTWLDNLKALFLGSAFAVGCSTCFGGALFISLMIYVGTVGSPVQGALALFLFSIGIAIPYLLSAFFLSRALALLGSLQKVSAAVGLVCSVVLIASGVILITDNFHVPSSWLYGLYLGLQ
ncbi:MAG: hypothetical protein HY644_10390 [Acidobacteria bacterium]|nr:hypothetical protein [Acidobacteriota bacterium]